MRQRYRLVSPLAPTTWVGWLAVAGCSPQAAPGLTTPPLPVEDAAAFTIGFPAQDGGSPSFSGSQQASVLPGDPQDASANVSSNATASAGASSVSTSAAGAPGPPDASGASASIGARPQDACPQPPGAGALAIDELMIESVAGSGDNGQWLEVESLQNCSLNLKGLHGECPRGASVVMFDVVVDTWVAPKGSFLIADSLLPAVNHYLPGTVIAWSGRKGDILRHKGTTVTLSMNGELIDSVTYPALALTVGASVAFPSDCPVALRSDWTNWQTSTASWFPGFFGTPNAPNDDVTCPAGPGSDD